MICRNCGQENPAVARFCLACGSSLTTGPTTSREARKTVTVVFSDVTGSTSLGEQLDAEALRRVMSRYFNEMRTVLERHGATVEKFIGDAVMAVFGIPTVHEDDALRAVRAAIEMRNALDELNEELERERGVRIQTRTGVNTGEVVAGDPATGGSLVTGDAVNVAARLEQAAEPSEILIGELTHRLTRDSVRVEAVPPLSIRGKDAPLVTFRLLDMAPVASQQSRRHDAPLVGRARELRLLDETLEQSSSSRACYLFTLLGPAGVGKSRLVEEFVRSISGQATILRGRCLPYGDGITFWPISEVVQEAAQLTGHEAPEEARGKIRALLKEEEDASKIADRVSEVIGLTGAPAVTDELFWGVRKLFEALARSRPLVIVFDDIHWGEATFLDLIEHIADWSRDAPVLLVCMARPELLESRPAWAGGKLHATTVLLGPLNDDECQLLIEHLLGGAEVAEEIPARISEAAEGNALFVEEMLGMLIDDGVLQRANGRWQTTADPARLSMPPTIHALLGARIDRLTSGERSAIERASVEGKVFHRGAVEELSAESDRPSVSSELMALVRKDLIRPDRPNFADEEAFRFRHILIHDVAYESVPKEVRADLHKRYAAWLESKAGPRASEWEEIIGYHLEQSHLYTADLGPLDEKGRRLAAQAAERLNSAGLRAMARGDMIAADSLLSRGTALLTPDSPARPRLLLALGTAITATGDLSRAEGVFSEAAERAAEAGEQSIEMRSRLELSSVRAYAGHHEQSDVARLAREAIQVFETAGDEAALARAWSLLSNVDWMACRWADHAEGLEQAAFHARLAGDELIEGEIRSSLAWAVYFGPAPVPDAIGRCEEILEKTEGRRAVEGSVLIPLAGLHAMEGRFEQARELYRRAEAALRELGLRFRAAAQVWVGAEIETLAGDPAAAERAWRGGIRSLEEMGERAFISTLWSALARNLIYQGRVEEAERYATSGRDTATDDLTSQVLWRAAEAMVTIAKGDLEQAETLAREAVALIEETDMLNVKGDALTDLAAVLRAGGRREEATTAVRDAVRCYELKGNSVSLGKATRLLQENQQN